MDDPTRMIDERPPQVGTYILDFHREGLSVVVRYEKYRNGVLEGTIDGVIATCPSKEIAAYIAKALDGRSNQVGRPITALTTGKATRPMRTDPELGIVPDEDNRHEDIEL